MIDLVKFLFSDIDRMVGTIFVVAIIGAATVETIKAFRRK